MWGLHDAFNPEVNSHYKYSSNVRQTLQQKCLYKWEKVCPYNIVTINHKYQIINGSNFNPQLKLLFYSLIITNNNLLFRICYDGVVTCKNMVGIAK